MGACQVGKSGLFGADCRQFTYGVVREGVIAKISVKFRVFADFHRISTQTPSQKWIAEITRAIVGLSGLIGTNSSPRGGAEIALKFAFLALIGAFWAKPPFTKPCSDNLLRGPGD